MARTRSLIRPVSRHGWRSFWISRKSHRKIFMPTDDFRYRALALAQAEARIVAAASALREFEQNLSCGSSGHDLAFEDFIQEVLPPDTYGRPKGGRFVRLLKSMHRIKLSDISRERRGRLRLLKRYLSEAKSKRRKAFAT
jgi:hypothetical protein